jgi:predicted RND superfamily exporter protein
MTAMIPIGVLSVLGLAAAFLAAAIAILVLVVASRIARETVR